MADQKVLETFKRFDSDGSGSISREELGEVLKSLEGSVWDDASIDGLLAAADESGDGELQVEEFVKWVFAEDQAISGGVTGKFILKVSGCSRPELNGVYVKQAECYYRRPIFHCIENEKYLFYHGSRQQWQIYSRTGKYASARLKTHRAAHMPGDNVKWAVWKTSTASKKKSFVQESRMKCTAEPHMSAEEEFAKAADAIKFDEIFFKKTEESLGNRPVYKQWKGDDWAERFLFYEGPKSMWKVGNSAAFGRPSLYTSRTTDVYSPDLALWMDEARGGKIAVLAVDTDGVPNGMHGGLKINRAIKDGWKDPAFPHNNDSIGEKAAKNCKYSRWLRARALHSHPALFADVEPADARQGTVGNCWLIAAMSALAEFPSYIKNNLFVTKKVSKDGKYKIKLFDGRSNRWEIIEIDDYLPCTPWGGDKPDLLFGHMPDGKMCLALLEKAFAKMYGSWSDLAGGFQAVAWFHMTSCTEYVCYSASYRGSAPKWVASSDISVVAGHTKSQALKRLGKLGEGANFEEKQRIGPWIEFKKLDGDGPESGWLKYYANGKRLAKRTAANELRVIVVEAAVVPQHAMGAISGDKTSIGKAFDYSFKKYVDAEEMWEILLKCDEGNYLMVSSASKSRIERDSGMVHGHAYSVLHAVGIEGLRLVCCRNPWGNDSEWNGPWSDRSPEWKAHPSIAEALNVDFQTEGSFWMDFEDWLYVMGQLKVMNCKMPSRRGDFHNQIVEEDEDEQEDVPEDVQEDAEDEDEDEGSGTIKGCSGLGIDWHSPRTMAEGILLYPDKDYTFQNVPPVLFGGTYIGSHCWPKAGTWTIEYQAPAKLYVWAAQGQFNAGIDDALGADGWTAEPAENLCGGAISLNLWSKQFDTGSSYSIEVVGDTMVGGVIGTTPCVQLTPPTRSEAVGGCAGLGVDWHPGRTMAEGILLYPDKDYTFENVPQVLFGGTYIGSHCWPKAGTWTIEYQAPVKLYVWATQGKYSGGVEDVLPADGWAVEAADGFCGGAMALKLWSRHFTTGSSYSIKVSSDTMVAGVVGKQLECSGKVTGCSGLGVGWNPPRGMAEGILIYTDKDYTFQNVPACRTSGTYIGSHCWPKAGTWTIEYEAPTMLYVWVQQGTYNAGVDEVLKADGWLQEDAKDFLNVALGLDGFGSGLPLTLWSRHFASGSSYSIETKDLMIGGVISECSDV